VLKSTLYGLGIDWSVMTLDPGSPLPRIHRAAASGIVSITRIGVANAIVPQRHRSCTPEDFRHIETYSPADSGAAPV